MIRLVSIVEKLAVGRASDIAKYRIHTSDRKKRTTERRLLMKIGPAVV